MDERTIKHFVTPGCPVASPNQLLKGVMVRVDPFTECPSFEKYAGYCSKFETKNVSQACF